MTISHLSEQNFWGGNSYRHPEGYRPRDNVGQMRHDSFELVDVTPRALTLRESLTWITSTGEHWVAERRDIRIRGKRPARHLGAHARSRPRCLRFRRSRRSRSPGVAAGAGSW
jgi:hypothetical protein